MALIVALLDAARSFAKQAENMGQMKKGPAGEPGLVELHQTNS